MTAQGQLQAAIRSITGNSGTYNEDWIALFNLYSIGGTDFNGRLQQFLKLALGGSDDDLSGLMAKYAKMAGAYNWSSMSRFPSIPLVGDGNLSEYATFTRSSSATYFDSNGILQTASSNEPRIDYLQDDSGLRGLLLEPSGTNLALQSEDFATTWSAVSAISVNTNAIASPDGNITADEFVSDETNNPHFITQNITTTNTETYTLSFFAKSAVSDYIQIVGGTAAYPANAYATYDLANGVVGTVGVDVVSTSITSYPNGWHRCALTITADATSATNAFTIALVDESTSTRLEASTAPLSVYVFGAQYENSLYASSYIPTTVSQVTRAADVATIDLTSVDWYEATKGSVVINFVPQDITNSNLVSVYEDGSNYILGRLASGSGLNAPSVFVGGVSQASQTTGNTATINTYNKSAWSYEQDDFTGVLNAGTATTDTSGSIPGDVTTLSLGVSPTGTEQYAGILTDVCYYPLKLSNSVLQELTQ